MSLQTNTATYVLATATFEATQLPVVRDAIFHSPTGAKQYQ